MHIKPESLYLSLIKKTLSFLLWPEPPTTLIDYASAYEPLKKYIQNIAKCLDLDPNHIKISYDYGYSDIKRIEGQIWPVYADTMIGLKRLDNLQYCIETILQDKIDGDLIETGVWRGGATIFMRSVLAAYKVKDRKVFVADSFEGLPKPDVINYPQDIVSNLHEYRYLAISLENVMFNFERYGLLDEQVVFLKGWFKDTLPNAPINKLSILRLDGDNYESTINALENLYSKLSPGGFCIIDDLTITRCRNAVSDFRKKNKIRCKIIPVDNDCGFWRKS